MKNKLLFLVFVLLHNHSFSQINFESGYFINNDGERIDCWIKNVGWGSNPNSFTYRLQEGTKSLNRTVKWDSNQKKWYIYNGNDNDNENLDELVDKFSEWFTILSNIASH